MNLASDDLRLGTSSMACRMPSALAVEDQRPSTPPAVCSVMSGLLMTRESRSNIVATGNTFCWLAPVGTLSMGGSGRICYSVRVDREIRVFDSHGAARAAELAEWAAMSKEERLKIGAELHSFWVRNYFPGIRGACSSELYDSSR